jgi:hypothetical protein
MIGIINQSALKPLFKPWEGPNSQLNGIQIRLGSGIQVFQAIL